MIKIWSKPGGSGGTACLKRLLKGLGCSRLKKCHCHQLSRWMARPKILRWGARQRRKCHQFQWSPAIVDNSSSERQEAKTLETLEKPVVSLILFFSHCSCTICTTHRVKNWDGKRCGKLGWVVADPSIRNQSAALIRPGVLHGSQGSEKRSVALGPSWCRWLPQLANREAAPTKVNFPLPKPHNGTIHCKSSTNSIQVVK